MAVVAWLTQQTAADWCRAARLLRLTIKHSPQSLALPGLMVKSRLLRGLGPRRAAPITQFHRRALCRISSQRCTGAHWCLLPRAAEASAEAAHTSAHTCWPLREPHEQGLTSALALVCNPCAFVCKQWALTCDQCSFAAIKHQDQPARTLVSNRLLQQLSALVSNGLLL